MGEFPPDSLGTLWQPEHIDKRQVSLCPNGEHQRAETETPQRSQLHHYTYECKLETQEIHQHKLE